METTTLLLEEKEFKLLGDALQLFFNEKLNGKSKDSEEFKTFRELFNKLTNK
jgi:soluble cytochrome b562